MTSRCLPFLLLFALFLSACGGKKPTRVSVPPPPPIAPSQAPEAKVPPSPTQETQPKTAAPAEQEAEGEAEVITLPADAKPLSEETGIASWYGAPYHNRRGSNG